MPKARWDIEADDIDSFDRSSQFTPYRGPQPPRGVYSFLIKKAVFIAATREKLPSLRLGLELIPRDGSDDRQYRGFYFTAFLPVSNKTQFRYVPLLDAIGVSSNDFINKTITDAEGNISRIGRWRNDGETIIDVQIQLEEDNKGNPQWQAKGFYAPDENATYDGSDDDDDYDDDEEYADDDDESDGDDYDDDDDYEEEKPARRGNRRR